MGKTSNKEYKNHSFSYKEDQVQERRAPKGEYEKIVDLDDFLQINNPLANKRKMQRENSQEKDKEAYVEQNSDNDYELSDIDPPT